MSLLKISHCNGGPPHLDCVIVVNAKTACLYPRITRKDASDARAFRETLMGGDLRLDVLGVR